MIDQINEILKRTFPYENYSSINHRDKNLNLIHSNIIIPPNNSYFKNSKYFLPQDTKIVHFSNLYALQSILKEKNLRLYNLRNLNDPREFLFAASLLSIDKKKINDAKENIYTLSLCSDEILLDVNKVDQFNLWRLYGDSGKGIALKLKIENDPINWKDYHFSKIHYGIEEKSDIRAIGQLIGSLEQNNPSYNIDLGKLLCFHKSQLFKIEKEIRIVFDNRKIKGIGTQTISMNNRLLSPVLHSDIIKSNEKNSQISYHELPVLHHDFNHISETIPILKIDEIIIGYMNKGKFYTMKKQLKRLTNDLLGYEPIISLSCLSDDYWGDFR